MGGREVAKVPGQRGPEMSNGNDGASASKADRIIMIVFNVIWTAAIVYCFVKLVPTIERPASSGPVGKIMSFLIGFAMYAAVLITVRIAPNLRIWPRRTLAKYFTIRFAMVIAIATVTAIGYCVITVAKISFTMNACSFGILAGLLMPVLMDKNRSGQES